VLDEISNDANDPYLLEFQAGVQATLGKAKLTLAGSYYQTFNLTDMGVFIGAAVPASQSSSANRGNATRQPGGAGTTLFYLDDFQVVSVRAEAALTLADKPFLGTPVILTLSGEYVHNLANEFDNLTGSTQTLSPGQTDGWTVQAAFGSNKNQGEWQIAYQYKHLEADAVWDAISDADWGTGSTDRKGHVLKGSYNVRDWWQLGFTMFVTEKISLRPNSGQNIRGLKGDDLLRLQLDSSFKF
jgi:hypothetical protein